MEVLNLLKFWKTSPTHGEDTTINYSTTTTTTLHTDLSMEESENDVDEEDSFFELEITAPDYDNGKNRDTQDENIIKNHKNGGNIGDYKDQAKTCFSQNDIIFAEPNISRFKCRKVLPIEPNSKPQSPISILKSAPKFRIFRLGLNSSKTRKTEKAEENRDSMETPKHSQRESKKFTLKINFEEGKESPSLSMFTRVNSSRTTDSKMQKKSTNDASKIDSSKRFPKDSVQKYLKLIKPFYVKVSKRYSDRVKLSDMMYSASPSSSPSPSPAKNGPSGFRVLSGHLGKSRSASAAVGVVSPAMNRRDESLLQQDDWIQSAILHCKRSFNSSRGESCLSRCTSDSTSHEKLTDQWRKSTEETDGC